MWNIPPFSLEFYQEGFTQNRSLHTYVTGFAKTVPTGTIEIHFMALHYSYTVVLSKYTMQMDIDSQVSFHRWLCSSLSNHVGASQGL